MRFNFLKKLLLPALAIMALVCLTSPAQAQTQVTSYNNDSSSNFTCQPCGMPGSRNTTDNFHDTYDYVSGTHTGSINFEDDQNNCGCSGFGTWCDYTVSSETLTSVTIYDTQGHIILSIGGSTNANWTSVPGGQIGRIAFTTFYRETDNFDDGNGGCAQSSFSMTEGHDPVPFTQTRPCPTAAGSTFTSSPSTINAGQTATLTWNFPNANTVTIPTVGTFGPSGSVSVTPASTTTYTATTDGDATCTPISLQATVTVNQPPSITAFAASANPICAGQSTTLSYTSANGTSATITDLTSGTVTSVPVPNGSLSVAPASSRTYRLTVTNAAGSVTQDLAMTVNPLAVINTFSASATTINVGQSTTFTYNVSNTSSRTITDLSTGVVTTLSTESGTQTFSPATTRTYRLTATNGCNSVTQDITITVTQPPTITGLAASTSPVCSGNASTLTWTATGGTSATISAPGLPGSPVSVNPDSGSLVVNPTTTTVYTLTETNSAGSVTQTTTVVVTPPPAINSYAASANPIFAGQSTTLSYSLAGTASATITDLTSGTVTNVPVQSGSLVVTPPTSRTYRLTANGTCGTVTQDITITVTPQPSITAFSPSASPICAGGNSTLSWTASGGTTATISAPGLPGSPVAVNPNSGTLVVNPTTTTVYTLTETNGAGSTTATTTVTVTPAPSIGSYSASASTINAGQSTTLSYTSANGTSATITDLTSGTVTSVPVPNGSLSVTPATTRTYRLTISGSCGTVTQDQTITVNQSPTITGLTASPSSVCAGSSSTLSWTSTGGTTATITDLTSGTVTSVPVNGSLVVTPVSSRTYRLTVTNAAGSTTQTVPVTVNPLAAINSFSASATTITAGQSMTFTYSVSNTTSRSITDLSTGTVTILGTESGTQSFSPATTRTYRLTATNGCNSVTQDITITVTPCQAITSFTASPPTVGTGASSTLSWNTTGGTTATITDLTSGTVTNVALPSGTLSVTPASTRTYRLALNGPCATVTQDVTITVTACNVINSFTVNGISAEPISVGKGTTLTVAWNISNFSTANLTVYLDGVSQGPTPITTSTGTRTYVANNDYIAFVLTVDGACAEQSQLFRVFTTACPTAAGSSFSASPSTVSTGQQSTLTWNVPNAASVQISGVPGTFGPSGSVSVTPAATTTYTLTATGASGCTPVTLQTTVTSAGVLIGPLGHPDAVGPTSNMDDYTNMTQIGGVAVPPGGVTTAGAQIVFPNTIRNLSTADDLTYIQAGAPPPGYNIEISTNGGASYVPLAGTSIRSNVPASSDVNILIRITLPAGVAVLTSSDFVVRVSSGVNPAAIYNETIERPWTGFVRAVKSDTITNSTGIGGPTDPVNGAIIQYVVNYSNITTASGSNNVNLTATNLVLTENGNVAPNNWANTTTHVAGSATDSLGGTITGDTAGSSLLTDTISSLAPGQSGLFSFRRKIK